MVYSSMTPASQIIADNLQECRRLCAKSRSHHFKASSSDDQITDTLGAVLIRWSAPTASRRVQVALQRGISWQVCFYSACRSVLSNGAVVSARRQAIIEILPDRPIQAYQDGFGCTGAFSLIDAQRPDSEALDRITRQRIADLDPRYGRWTETLIAGGSLGIRNFRIRRRYVSDASKVM